MGVSAYYGINKFQVDGNLKLSKQYLDAPREKKKSLHSKNSKKEFIITNW